jgi:putative peptide zinc metalloprotease protein
LPINPILFQSVFMGIFGALMNLLPMLECDGYYILMDWIEIPMLRKKSLAFLKEVLGKLFARHRFNREEKILTVFGVVTATSTGLIMAFAIYLWQSRVTAMLGELASGNDPVSTILAGALAIIVGAPLILGLGIRAILLVGAMIERAQRIHWNQGGGT